MDSTEKKTEVITLRTSEKTKKTLQEEAKKLDWTTAKLAEKILTEWAQNSKKTGGSITFIIEKNETINVKDR